MEVKVASLLTYPLKSAQGIELSEAKLGNKGLPWDRHWMLIDESCRFVSQRTTPRMALLSVSLFADRLEVDFPGNSTLSISIESPKTQLIAATMHQKDEIIQVVNEGTEAGKWMSEALEKKVRVVRIAPGFERSIPDSSKEAFEVVELADGFPFLVASNASLDLLNQEIRKSDSSAPPIEMRRLRPNIVLDMTQPWAEMGEGLSLQNSGAKIQFSLVKPCQRCGIPQVNSTSGIRDAGAVIHQCLQRLHRNHGHEPNNVFGQNAVLVAGAGELLSVGDVLKVVPTQ